MFTLPGQRDMAVGCGHIELMPRQVGEKQVELVSRAAIAGFYPQDGPEILLHMLIHSDVGIVNRLSDILRGDRFCPAIYENGLAVQSDQRWLGLVIVVCRFTEPAKALDEDALFTIEGVNNF